MTNKKIIITGASSGIGKFLANHFYHEGSELALLARKADKIELNSGKGNVRLIPADLTNLEELQNAINQAIEFLDNVDIVIHAMGGGLGLNDDLISAPDFIRLFMTNVGAAAEINRMIIPLMKQQKQGTLIHLGSNAGYEDRGSVGYGTVKAALAGYVRILGRKLIKDNIVCAGMLLGAVYAEGSAMWRFQKYNPEGYKNFSTTELPTGQVSDASELLPIINVLCNSNASIFAGSLIPMDAGLGKAFYTHCE